MTGGCGTRYGGAYIDFWGRSGRATWARVRRVGNRGAASGGFEQRRRAQRACTDLVGCAGWAAAPDVVEVGAKEMRLGTRGCERGRRGGWVLRLRAK